MSQGGFSPLDYPSTLLSFWGFSNLFQSFPPLLKATVNIWCLKCPAFWSTTQRPCDDFTKIGGSKEQHRAGATAFGWLEKGLPSSPIPTWIDEQPSEFAIVLKLEFGSFSFMMKQYQAPDVLIRSIQFSEFHCDHESKVYFGPTKNAAIHLRLVLNFNPYPMWIHVRLSQKWSTPNADGFIMVYHDFPNDKSNLW